MKQKIVIRVCDMTCCDKCRSKAMAVAAATCGVDSVAIGGKDRDELVVVGECVDPVRLTCALRKKVCASTCALMLCKRVCRALLLEVSEVKDDKKPPPPPAEAKKNDKKPPPPPPQQPFTFVCHLCCHPPGYVYYSCHCYCHCH